MLSSPNVVWTFSVGLFVIVVLFIFEINIFSSIGENGKNTQNRHNSLSGYHLVSSSECKIPNLNPFDLSVASLIRRKNRTVCSSRPPLTEVLFDSKTRRTIFRINKDVLPVYTDFPKKVVCCVSAFYKKNQSMFLENCTVVKEKKVLTPKHQFIMVYCYQGRNGSLIYKNAHAAVIKLKTTKSSSEKKMNVLMIGLDSMSRLNFLRTMPKSVTHLHTNGWVEMRGYNKIADNTLPNLMAVLTGFPPVDLKTAYRSQFDNFPFAWKDFSADGFVTAYVEDMFRMNTFDCNLRGFAKKPTDHYLREFFVFTEEIFDNDKMNGNAEHCLGSKSSSEHVFDYIKDFVQVYKYGSFFGLFWVNEIGHSDINQPSSKDSQVLELLEKLRSSEVMDTTMVVLFSDHGFRVGEIRRTELGWYEDRLPLLFISLPDWFKTRHSDKFLNLLKNSERLTSPYDLHLTLKDVLQNNQTNRPKGCSGCASLLDEIPEERSCSDAGIDRHWCSCHGLQPLPTGSDLALRLGNSIVRKINEKMADEDLLTDFRCRPYVLSKVLYLRKKTSGSVEGFVVGVEVRVSGAQFEGTVVRTGPYHDTVEESFSRLNLYGQESHCAFNPEAKKYCFCE